MEITYGSNKLRRQMETATDIKKAFGQLAKKIAIRRDDIVASPSLAVLKKIPAANCHPLTGNRMGEWAVDVSANFRMIFTMAHDPVPLLPDGSVDAEQVTRICMIEIEDYH